MTIPRNLRKRENGKDRTLPREVHNFPNHRNDILPWFMGKGIVGPERLLWDKELRLSDRAARWDNDSASAKERSHTTSREASSIVMGKGVERWVDNRILCPFVHTDWFIWLFSFVYCLFTFSHAHDDLSRSIPLFTYLLIVPLACSTTSILLTSPTSLHRSPSSTSFPSYTHFLALYTQRRGNANAVGVTVGPSGSLKIVRSKNKKGNSGANNSTMRDSLKAFARMISNKKHSEQEPNVIDQSLPLLALNSESRRDANIISSSNFDTRQQSLNVARWVKERESAKC